MTMTLQAVFENGVLRPQAPLSLPEGQQVQVLVSMEEATRRVGHSSGKHLPHPRHSLGGEGRDEPGRIVPDTAPIGPAIVAAGEDGPQVQRHLAVARQQGNGELGEGVLQFPGVNEEPARLVETMHGNVVVVQTSLVAKPFQGHGSRVFAATEQIDFHQVDRAAQDFALLLQVQVPALFAGRLVGQAKNLDDRHEPLALVVPARADFHFHLRPLVVGHLEDQRLRSRRHGNAAGLGADVVDALDDGRIRFDVPRRRSRSIPAR